MKYLFMPFSILVICIYTLCEIIFLVLWNAISILWYFNKKHTLDWTDWTQDENDWSIRQGYDKTPYETIKRRVTKSGYKQKKKF